MKGFTKTLVISTLLVSAVYAGPGELAGLLKARLATVVGLKESIDAVADGVQTLRTLSRDFAKKNDGTPYPVFSKTVKPGSGYGELNEFSIHLGPLRDSRNGKMVFLDLSAESGAGADEVDQLIVLADKASERAGLGITFVKQKRNFIQANVSEVPFTLIADKMKVVRFIEEMAAMGNRMEAGESLASVIARAK